MSEELCYSKPAPSDEDWYTGIQRMRLFNQVLDEYAEENSPKQKALENELMYLMGGNADDA